MTQHVTCQRLTLWALLLSPPACVGRVLFFLLAGWLWCVIVARFEGAPILRLSTSAAGEFIEAGYLLDHDPIVGTTLLDRSPASQSLSEPTMDTRPSQLSSVVHVVRRLPCFAELTARYARALFFHAREHFFALYEGLIP